MAVPHLPVAVADAPGGALPNHLPAIGAHLKAVAVVLRLVLVSHETKEGHVYWCHPKLEGLKVQAEVLPEAVKHLLADTKSNFSVSYQHYILFIDSQLSSENKNLMRINIKRK